jgi:hypothetical protein
VFAESLVGEPVPAIQDASGTPPHAPPARQ